MCGKTRFSRDSNGTRPWSSSPCESGGGSPRPYWFVEHVGLGEHRVYRVRESFQSVNTGNENVLHSAILEDGQYAKPEVRARANFGPDPVRDAADGFRGDGTSLVFLDELADVADALSGRTD